MPPQVDATDTRWSRRQEPGVNCLVLPIVYFAFFSPQVDNAEKLVKSAAEADINLRLLDRGSVTISLDETTTLEDVDQLLAVLNNGKAAGFSAESLAESVCKSL